MNSVTYKNTGIVRIAVEVGRSGCHTFIPRAGSLLDECALCGAPDGAHKALTVTYDGPIATLFESGAEERFGGVQVLAALRRALETSPRRAPVQGPDQAGTVAWEIHELAWRNYADCGHGSQSAEVVAQRGGFSYQEMQCALAGHYNRTGKCGQVHPNLPTFEPAGRR